VSTSAFQIEGGLPATDRCHSIWDTFCRRPGGIADASNGDRACDSYARWREDVDLLKTIGVNAYRFSIAWPRIFPEHGRLNEAALDHYEQLVDALLETGIEPWVTLYHWDLPQYLEDAGGWPERDLAKHFAEFANAVSLRLGDRVKHWITLNEPWCAAFLGYHEGVHAPGRKSLRDALAAVHTMLFAHGRAVQGIRTNSKRAKVGLSLNPAMVYAATEEEPDLRAAERYDGYFNRWFLDPLYGRGYPTDLLEWYGADAPFVHEKDFNVIAARTDFLGVNYYSPYYITAGDGSQFLNARRVYPDSMRYTDMCLGIESDALETLLYKLSANYPVRAIFVTENGAAYTDPPATGGRVHDHDRIAYLRDHIIALASIKLTGVRVDGYFVWSLLDNFEWELGYTQKFGIVQVDPANGDRTLKDSAYWYRDFIRKLPSYDPGA
jgi:beta-glucosidase